MKEPCPPVSEIETIYERSHPDPDYCHRPDHFDVLLTLIETYESKHFPIDLPDPVEAIKFRMEQAGLTPKDLVPAIGRLNRVYEILGRKRPLMLNMIWRLHENFGIPAESLIQPPKLSAA